MKFHILVPLLLVAGCAANAPRYAPEDVAPPPWPPALVQERDAAAAPAEPPAPPAVVPPGTETVPLAIADAVVLAFENNRSISVAELDPQITSTTIDEARAEFDPAVSASLRSGRNTQRLATDLGDGGGTIVLPGDVDLGGGIGVGESDAFDNLRDIVEGVDSIVSEIRGPDTVSRTRDLSAVVVGAQRFSTGTQLTVTADYSGVRNNLSDDLYQGGWNVEVSQALLRGRGRGINLITLRQAQLNAAISEHALRQQILETVRQVELAYWDLVLARELLTINQFAVGLADEQMRLNEDLLRVGRAVEADVLSAGADRASRQADVIDAEAQIQDRNIALIRLLNPEAAAQWNIIFEPTALPEAPPVTVVAEESVLLALDYRPELAQARLDLTVTDLDVRRARNNLLPRLDVVGSYGRASSGDTRSRAFDFLNDEDEESYAVGLELESSIRRRGEKARYRRSLLSQTQRERIVSDTEQALEAEVRQAVIEVQRQWARIGATQEAVLARASQLETAQARYRAGRGTNLDVLIVQRDFIQSQIDEVAARVGYLQALTSLHAAEGTLLERRGIAFEEKLNSDT